MSIKKALFGGGVETGATASFQGSIQDWLPVKNIIGGVVITKDNRFIKILEIVPVNINTATEEELIAVEGIGPALARRIIAYREENGPFQTIDELDNVKGIGPSLIENIRYLVCTEDKE